MDKEYQQELKISIVDLEDNLALSFENMSILRPEITPGCTYRETECLFLPLLFFFFLLFGFLNHILIGFLRTCPNYKQVDLLLR